MINKAIQFEAKGKAGFIDIGEPGVPGPYEVLMRTRFSGITNGTERHMLMSDFGPTPYPKRVGYQQVGIIEAMGSEVQGFAVGDTVFYGNFVGHASWNIVRVLPDDPTDIRSHLLVKIPAGVDPKLAALSGTAGVAIRAVRRFRISAGQNVWVVGAGLIGQFAAQAARAAGARVMISDVRDDRLELARQCGAHRVLNAKSADFWKSVEETGPFHCIVDAAGAKDLLDEILQNFKKVIRPRTVIGLMAIRNTVNLPWGILHTPEGSIEVACHFSRDDLRILYELVLLGLIRIAPLVTLERPWRDAVDVYGMLRDQPGEQLGMIFDWT